MERGREGRVERRGCWESQLRLNGYVECRLVGRWSLREDEVICWKELDLSRET